MGPYYLFIHPFTHFGFEATPRCAHRLLLGLCLGFGLLGMTEPG